MPAPPTTATPPPSATQAATRTQTPTAAPSATPTETSTATPTPRPTVALSSLPLPPEAFEGESHFFFGNPVGEGVSGFVAASYRYGSIGPGQRFAPHHGVDLSSPAASPLVAVAPGTIYYAGSDLERIFGPETNFYGNLVVLQLAQTWKDHIVYALYGHLDQVLTQTGLSVNTGDVLGTVGATGVALGPHLHVEVRLDFPESYWDTRNPELWLAPSEGMGAVAVRVTNQVGRYLPGVRVSFICSDGAPRYVDTYWYNGVNPDDLYGENAAMTNLPPGYCDFEAEVLGEQIQANDALISPGAVTFVWLRP